MSTNIERNRNGLVLVDFINEIVDPSGKLAGKGYGSFIEKHGTLDKVHALLEKSRNSGILVFHVRVGFSTDYCEHPESSPLFGGAKKFGALQLGTWATEFHPKAAPKVGEQIIVKHRVSAFYGTPLELVLRNNSIRNLIVVGVATDLAVQAAVRDAHDRDFNVTVVADCCAAASDEDHQQSLSTLSKIASVITLSELAQAAHAS